GVDPKRRLFMVLPTCPWPTSLDHVRCTADKREQCSLIGGEAAAADRRVENGDTRQSRPRVERLHGVGLGRRGHDDNRAGREMREQAIRPEHDLVDFMVIADADDHKIRGACNFGWGLGRGGPGITRLGQLLLVEVAGGHLVAVLDEMCEHRKTHAADAHDAYACISLSVHRCPLGLSSCAAGDDAHTFALSSVASGLFASASSLASTGTLRSISRRATAISRWALMPHAYARRGPSSSNTTTAPASSHPRPQAVGCARGQPTLWIYMSCCSDQNEGTTS